MWLYRVSGLTLGMPHLGPSWALAVSLNGQGFAKSSVSTAMQKKWEPRKCLCKVYIPWEVVLGGFVLLMQGSGLMQKIQQAA